MKDGAASDGASSGGGDAGDEDNKPVCTVWHGYDVVLTDNCHPSERRTKDAGDKIASPPPRTDSNTSSVRRRGSARSDDYGWIRKLELRKDMPSIDEIRSWSFDVLEFEDTVLISVFIKMLEYYDLLTKFQLDRDTLQRYCGEVMKMHHKDCYYQKVDIERGEGATTATNTAAAAAEEEKEPPPDILCEYHNWYHASSCAHACFLFLTLGGADQYLRPMELFAIIMGALIHDLDHPGTNNDFEIKRSTSLAKLYGNDSVLERHSINMGLNLCAENPELDWLKSFADEQDREYVTHFIAESVLATDPARHGAVVKEALAFVEKGAPYFDQNDEEHRQFIGKLLLHSADIFNPLHSSFEVASDWAIRVTAEFSRQAEKEKELQLPVTTFMDGLDSQLHICKLQIGFFEWMVKPLYHTIGILFPNLKKLEEWGERNSAGYQAMIDEHEMKQAVLSQTKSNDRQSEEKGRAEKGDDSAYGNTDVGAPY